MKKYIVIERNVEDQIAGFQEMMEAANVASHKVECEVFIMVDEDGDNENENENELFTVHYPEYYMVDYVVFKRMGDWKGTVHAHHEINGQPCFLRIYNSINEYFLLAQGISEPLSREAFDEIGKLVADDDDDIYYTRDKTKPWYSFRHGVQMIARSNGAGQIEKIYSIKK